MTTPIDADKKTENFSDQNKMEENLKKIEDQIRELRDGDDNKANDVIEWLQWILNAEFAKILKPDTAKGLLKSIDEYKSKLKNGENLPDWLQDLIDFLEPIANPIWELKDGEDWVVGLKKDEVTKWQFYGKLEGLNRPKTEDDKQNTKKQDDKKSGDENKTKEWVDKNQASESNVDKNAELNALEVLNKKIGEVDDLIKVEEGKTLDSRLQTLKTTLSNIQKVVGNPTKDNTMKLQKFIWETCYKDLDSNNAERERYESENHMKEWKFDGQFWDVTLEWLYKLLDKIKVRIEDINQAIEVEEKNNNQPTNWNEIADSKWKDWSNEWKQKTGWWIDDSGNWTSSKSVATEVSKDIPKTVTVNKISYNLLTDYQTLASKNLPGAVFYWLPVEGQNSDFQSMINRVEKSENTSWDIDAIMVYGKDKYQVKLDRFWNLKPTAINANSKVKVLFEKSCVNYLLNKVPFQIRGDCVIAWNSTMKDYVIRLKGQETGLTIEPIEIDWKWLWTSLERSLAMLHFTNILRKTKWIDDLPFENDNPDLKWDDGKLLVKVKKNKDIKWLSGSKHRYPVHLDDYALDFLRTDEVSRKNFLKYNNGEDWKDNWDKKDGNKYVKKPLEWQVQVGVVSSSNTPKSQPIHEPSNAAAREPVRTSQYTEVSQSTESQLSLNDSPELGEVVVMSTIFKPKNPIVWVGVSENEWDIGSKKDANFDGLWKFENGKFTFDANVIWNDGKMSIDEKNYDKVNIEGWIFVGWDKKAFTWEWYYLWDIIRDKNNSGENNIKYLYYGGYKDWLRSWKWTRVFENGAKYEWEWKEWKEEWIWKYTYTNGDTYEWAFVDGKFEWNWTFTFKESWITVDWEFKDNKLVSWNVALNWQYYQVERDEKWLKIITKWENYGKYIDLAKWSIKSVSVVDDVKWDKKSG